MPILDLQKRARELGRIRIGQVQPTSGGRTRPAKLDKFRLTSASKALLEKVAALYGGTVKEWTPLNGGAAQWEVLTDATRLPILVPPQPVSQWYELWSGGGCQRRCDGQREILTEAPCLCAQADDRICKPTTRLNVVLRDVEGIGVFRLETHGYYAAVELPNVAGFLEQAGGYVGAFLVLEERTVKRDNQTRRFMVPAIEIEGVTPGQLVSGQVAAPAVAGGQRAAIESGAQRDFVADIAAAGSRDDVVALWRAAKDAGVPSGPVEAAAKARVAELEAVADGAGGCPCDRHDGEHQLCEPGCDCTETSTPEPNPPAPEVAEPVEAVVVDPEKVWQELVQTAPAGWTLSTLEDAFAARYEGVIPADATGAQMREFATAITDGWVKPPANTNVAPF